MSDEPPRADPQRADTAKNGRSRAAIGSWLIHRQTTQPLLVLLIVLATALGAGLLASRLTLKTSFGELLPQNKESVRVAEQAAERLNSASTLTVVAQGSDPAALRRFIETLAPKIRALDPSIVGEVDDGVRASLAFFDKNKLLYAPLADIQKVHDEILTRYDYAIAKQMGTALDDEELPPLSAESIQARIDEGKAHATRSGPKYPGGYYMEADERMIALLIRTSVPSGDLEASHAFLATIQGIVDEVSPTSFDPTMTIGYTGDFITSAEEYASIKGDLSDVGVAGVAMILAVVFLFYLRVRPLLAMTLTVGVGVLWTFGFAYLAIGHLNSSTGFLVSIVVGNGINFAIIFMSRYLEERHHHPLDESIRIAQSETWVATLAAAGAAMVAYGSLVITNFRGFKHFGVIGGAGMILCWVATYACLPPILVLFERIAPVGPDGALTERLRGLYGRPIAYVVERAPRAIAIFGVLIGIGATALAVRYVVHDPMEYDMSKARNEVPKSAVTSAVALGRRVDKIVGRKGQDGLAILTDRLDQVLPLKAALDARRDAAPAKRKPFDKVVTIFDLLPSDQATKIELLDEAIDRLKRAHRHRLLSDKDWASVQKLLPESGLEPIGIDDLPEQVASSFIEKDGTRGRLVYIVPTSGRSVWDAHYLIDWAQSFRVTELPDGSVVKGSGRSVIFADLILTVVEDAPKAIIASLVGTLGIVLFAFRAKRAAWIVIATLALGLAWMMAALALHGSEVGWSGGVPHVKLVGMKLNFLNFVALPITIGVGADYAVNIMQRYRLEGPERLHRVLVETGGAVILCSLTTILGYVALTFSVNRAIQSFGFAAAAGEIGCLVAAVIVLPAFLVWRRRRALAR